MQTNITSSQENFNSEWLTAKQAAEHLKIMPRTYRRLLIRYAQNLTAYLKVQKSRGYTGTTTYISKAGLIVLSTIKNNSRKGAINTPLQITNAKQQIAEKAIEAVTLSDDPMIRQMQQSIELRKRQIEHEKRIGKVEQRVDLIESDKLDAQKALFELPAPQVVAPIRTDRSLIRECLAQYVRSKNGSGQDYAFAWEKLFTECNYRLNTNLTKRHNSTGKDRLDLLEEDGSLIQVYAIACEIFKTP